MNEKKEIIYFSKLMVTQGYSAGSEGNISIRIAENRFLITPSGRMKIRLEEKDILEIDGGGNLVKGKGKPTTERFTHLEVYRNRPDIKAIVHAHPFYTVLCSVLGRNPLEQTVMAEAGMFLTGLKIAPYAKPSTKEGAEAVRSVCKGSDILILDRHGSLTYGKNLEEAFSRLEILEKVCRMDYFVQLSQGEPRVFSKEEIEALRMVPY